MKFCGHPTDPDDAPRFIRSPFSPRSCPSLSAAAFALLLFITCPPPARACPACNINNYLARSVMSSTKVYVGTVLRQVDDDHAEVRVTRVLHGDPKPGDLVRQLMYSSARYVGQEFVFSDPEGMGLTFEAVPTSLEEEVRFILGHREAFDIRAIIERRGNDTGEADLNPIRDRETAIRWVQATSSELSGYCDEYLAGHHAECAPELVTTIDRLARCVFSPEGVDDGPDRLDRLLGALYLRTSEVGELAAIKWVAGFGTDRDAPVNWEDPWAMVGPRGEFLHSLLKHLPRKGDARPRAVELLRRRFASLTGRALAGATFALVAAGGVAPGELRPLLKDREALDLFASGLFWAGRERNLGVMERTFPDEWRLALEITQRPALRKLIEDRRPTPKQ